MNHPPFANVFTPGKWKEQLFLIYNHTTMHRIFTILIFMGLHAVMSGQVRMIQGVVTDEENQTLPGVNILVRGTTSGTISGIDGDYSIQVSRGDTLEFSYISYKTLLIIVEDQNRIDVSMEIESSTLEEVVVIGYGSIRKKDVTGAVSIINVEEMQKIPTSNIATALQGRVSGVQIINAAEPGLNPTVLVRGYGTIFGDPNPLVVIDGIQTTTGALSNLNPADIESMQVLKDASAAAIYGSRAANGVIIITTRTGQKERFELNFNMETGVQSVANRFEMMNTAQYAEYTKRLYVNSSTRFLQVNPPAWTQNEEVLATDTDWQDVSFIDGKIQNYNLSLQGGGENSSFFMGLGYLRQEGVFVNADFERYNFRINSSFKHGRLRIGEAVNIFYRQKPETDLARRPMNIYAVAPQMPIYDENNLNGLGSPFPFITGGNNLPNPLAYDYRSYVTNGFGAQGNIFAELDLVKNLEFRSELNLTFNNNAFERYYEPIAQSQAAITSTSYEIDIRNNSAVSINSENYFKYNLVQGKHRVNAMAGFTAIRSTNVGTISSGSNLEPGTRVPQTGTSSRGSGINNEMTLLSQLARVNYNYQDKYMITASIRRDGASNFSRQNRWGYFPSFSAGWNVSEEPFLKNIDWLTRLKIRGGYGELGRNLGTFLNTLNSEIRYPWTTGDISGVAPLNIPNENLRWERVKQYNIGMDLEVLSGKLTISTDYFMRFSEDMIIQVPLPMFTGIPESAWANVGSMSNNGVEFDFNYTITRTADFQQRIGFNFTMIKNKVKSLSATQDTLLANNTITTPGHPVASHYGWVVHRVNPDSGQMEFEDLTGNGRVSGADRRILGSPHPDGFFGFNYSASFKGFDISAFFQGVWGNHIFNDSRRNLQSTHLDRNRLASVLVDAFDPVTNIEGSLPIISLSNQNDNDRAADRWIERGDYIRLRNMQIGYTFPAHMLKRANLRSLRLYVNGINLVTWTKYSGLDPDISPMNDVFSLGLDNFRYPPVRSFNFGFQIGL